LAGRLFNIGRAAVGQLQLMLKRFARLMVLDHRRRPAGTEAAWQIARAGVAGPAVGDAPPAALTGPPQR